MCRLGYDGDAEFNRPDAVAVAHLINAHSLACGCLEAHVEPGVVVGPGAMGTMRASLSGSGLVPICSASAHSRVAASSTSPATATLLDPRRACDQLPRSIFAGTWGGFSRAKACLIEPPYPAWSLISVSGLASPGTPIEIPATAACPDAT